MIAICLTYLGDFSVYLEPADILVLSEGKKIKSELGICSENSEKDYLGTLTFFVTKDPLARKVDFEFEGSSRSSYLMAITEEFLEEIKNPNEYIKNELGHFEERMGQFKAFIYMDEFKKSETNKDTILSLLYGIKHKKS